MPNYSIQDEIEGGVFRKGSNRGHEGAMIAVSLDEIRARTDGGEDVSIAWPGVKIQRGGEGEVFVHSADRKTSIFSSDPQFLRALEGAGGNDVNDMISRLQGQRVSNRTKHLLGCTVVLAFVFGVFWVVPRAFRASVDAIVDALPYSVDEAIGEAVVGEMQVEGEEIEDEELRAAIQAMIDRLQPHIALPEAEFHFRIVKNEQINAFALPGGYITVFTGLIEKADRPEQVAGVLAHEISHVTLRHGLLRIAHSVGTWAGVRLLFGDTGALGSIAVDLFTLASVNDYSQEQETDADDEGVRMMVEARIDPRALAEFFQLLDEEYGDVPDTLSWLSTHPQHEERIAAIEAELGILGDTTWVPLDLDWEAVQKRLEEL